MPFKILVFSLFVKKKSPSVMLRCVTKFYIPHAKHATSACCFLSSFFEISHFHRPWRLIKKTNSTAPVLLVNGKRRNCSSFLPVIYFANIVNTLVLKIDWIKSTEQNFRENYYLWLQLYFVTIFVKQKSKHIMKHHVFRVTACPNLVWFVYWSSSFVCI